MYTSSYFSKVFNRVLLVTALLTALFTTVHAADINLALGKHATQSSNYYETVRYHAPKAVNGDTKGVWYTNSITHTNYEQGAWWQVDLGSKKNINQIIIYNRTDCCVDRLSNYQVSISNKADFSTHTYQQDFHVAPNPKKTIKLNTPGKQGRYVRIQLLDKNYLSLAEVQVMGVDPLRFAKVDYSSAHNDFGGFYNAPNYPNHKAFAALQADGSITAWGVSGSGGSDAPTDKGYTKIYSNESAFAALKADGAITAWGGSYSGGTGAPTDSGYTKIYSTWNAFAALKTDGSIKAWGDLNRGGTGVPTDKGYIEIYSNAFAFTAIEPDGTIRTWGNPDYEGAYASGYNLALGKPATESSTYPYEVLTVAGYAVDGNTDGKFINGSTTHTKQE
ncbi:hypothetical protein [uncultured Gammaproteobacteria bacterium]|nr:hypothetical protein [uncultured Gammaproteobacteria bacterium]